MATDQEIRDAGILYMPKQKYLQNPYEFPVEEEAAAPVNQGIVNTNAFTGGGGDGFSVYNADPNTITNMNPNSYALQDARRENELSYVGKTLPGDLNPLYSTKTAAMKNMEMYPEYYGLDKPPPSKISQLISKGIGFIPGIGTLTRVADFASGMLPANRRAIMENQLGTQGVMVNDIGQIVVGQGGSYNTPEGIMAGYNPAKMTDKTFTGRQENIGKTLQEKYGLTQEQVDGLMSGELTEEDFTGKQYNLKGTNKQTNLITNLINIEKARKNFANTTDTTDQIVDIKTGTKTNNNGNDGGGQVGGIGTAASQDHSQGQTGYGSCFIAGTKVTMADGTLKNIEDVVVGDKVKGHKNDNEVIKLDPTLLATRKLYSFNNNDHYFFTSEHPFMTEEGWKSIKPEKTKERDGVELYEQLKGELKVGDKLVTDKGSIEIKSIESKEINNPEMPLYNFNVSNDNSYIADGYVVHNKGGSGTGNTTDASGTEGEDQGRFAADGGLMYANGGRAGYFYGGRVNFKNGGLASLL